MPETRRESKFIKALKNHKIPYLIAEPAYLHEGNVRYLLDIVDELSKQKCCDAVKHHILIDVDSYITPSHKLYSLYKNCKLAEKDWISVLEKVKSKKLENIVLADEKKTIDFVRDHLDLVDAIELHAIAINNIEMLDKVKGLSLPLILGIGGSTLTDIEFALQYLKRKDILLTYGFQIYPTKFEYINLNRIDTLRNKFGHPVGYADHTSWDNPHNELITLAGFMKGANFIEKHVALKPGDKRIDFESAISIDMLCDIKRKIELLNVSCGDGVFVVSEYEKAVSLNGPMKFTIVATKDLKKGQVLTKEDITFKRTAEENTIEQCDFLQLLGKKMKVDVKKLELVNWEKVERQ